MPTAAEIAAAALEPKAVQSDATSVQNRDIRELIAAAEHAANIDAAARTGFPIRIFHTRPPASTGREE